MCESTAWLVKRDGTREAVMENVIFVAPSGDGRMLLEDILGDQKYVRGVVSQIRLLDHRIEIEETA